MGKTVVTDDIDMIRDAILDLFDKGADIVITTAGLSVDPDDVTRDGIEATGAKTLFYGTPCAGGNVPSATLDGKYILGAPACVYFNGYTALDIVLGGYLPEKKCQSPMWPCLHMADLCTLLRHLPLSSLSFRKRII